MTLEFEFGETQKCTEFLQRNPNFLGVFEQVISLGNKCFGRPSGAKSRLEDLCFSLGHTCRNDFTEVVFLAVNGYADAAFKIIRGLYERAVNIAYLIKYPEKAERFVHFAAIQEHRSMVATLKVVTEEQFDLAMAKTTSTARIRQIYEQCKPEFQATLCKKCGTTYTQSSWDVDFSSMVDKVGLPYTKYFFPAYSNANFLLHATLGSMFDGDLEYKRADVYRDSNFALFNGTIIFFHVLQAQNSVFKLGLETELDNCEREIEEVWHPNEIVRITPLD